MIKRIDLFMPPFSEYSVLHHFTHKFYEALTRLGVHCRILEAKFNDPKPFLQQIFNDPPDCTLSFNGLLPDENGYFFSDMIQIPHVACLTEPPTRFIELAKSPKTIITCMDSSGVDFFHDLGVSNVFFMPHGVEKNLRGDPESERPIDLLMLSTCIDYNEIRAEWQERFPASLCKALDEAAEATLSDQTTSHINAFITALDRHMKLDKELDLNTLPYVEALIELDEYIRGKERVDLIHAIKDYSVDIYGKGPWDKYVKNTKAKVHTPIEFKEALKLIGKSKIVLNSLPTTKHGTHTRILAGAIAGAVALTAENPYMTHYYKDKEDILYYKYRELAKVNQNIGALLSDDAKRLAIAHNGMKITLENHTWDHRASRLLKNLASILSH